MAQITRNLNHEIGSPIDEMCEDWRQANRTPRIVNIDGTIDLCTSTEFFAKLVTDVGDWNLVQSRVSDDTCNENRSQLWYRKDSLKAVTEAIAFSIYDDTNASIQGLFENPLREQAFIKLVRAVIKTEAKQGSIYVMVQNGNRYDLTRAGRVDAPLNRDNYTPGIIEHYDHILGCLKQNNPCGRVMVLDGPPGTGKSFMIRALATEAPGLYVLVSPSMLSQLSGPQVLPLLLDTRRSDSEPIVLVLEDADEVVVRREEAHNGVLADILNLGDGLIGEMCDIRIIATTNAKSITLDPALMRPGRLCRHLTLGPLGQAQSNSVLDRIGSAGDRLDGAHTLAEIYRAARGDGWTPNKKAGNNGQYL